MAEKQTRLQNQILHFTKLKQWDKVESRWSELAETPPNDVKFYATVAQRLVQCDRRADVENWWKLLIESCRTLDENKAIIQACRGALHAVPDLESLREPLIDAINLQYADLERRAEYIRISGLEHEKNLKDALNRFLQMHFCSEGEVFQHNEWGIGKVINVDLEGNRAIIEFPSHGKKDFTFEGIREFLKKISRSHFLAMRLLCPEELVKQSDADPVEFLKKVLRDIGGSIIQSELKALLLDGVFQERQWNSWWNKHREKFRLDSLIGFSGGAGNIRLELRAEPKAFHDEMVMDFQRAESFSRRYSILSDLSKRTKSEPMPDEVGNRLLAHLKMHLSEIKHDEENLSERLDILYLMEDLADAFPTLAPQIPEHTIDRLRAAEDPIRAICGIGNPDYQIRAACCLRDMFEDRWPVHAQSLCIRGPVRLGQWLLRYMTDNELKEVAIHVGDQILHHPALNTDLFLWFVRAVRGGKWPELGLDISPVLLLDGIIEQIEDAHRRILHEEPNLPAIRGLHSRLLNLLTEDHMAMVTEAFETFETDVLRERFAELMKSASVTPAFKIAADQAIRMVRHDLDSSTEKKDDDSFLVTEASLKQRQIEYNHIKEVDIPENSKTIGAAASEGDLRENAGYHAAKERQKVLFRRVESLEDLLHRAKVIRPEDVRTTAISVGTAFEVRNIDSGENEEYQLLGLWDANPEKRILNYQSPFGRQFLDRKIGETIVVANPGGGSTRYTVLSVRNALA
jgi:transcription elongation factor GreA